MRVSPRTWLSARRVHKGVTRGSAHGSAVTILKFLILFGEEPALASEGSFVPVSLPPRAPSAAWRVPGPPLGAHGLAPPPPALGLPLSLCGCLCRSRLPRRPGTLPRSTAPPSFLAPLPLCPDHPGGPPARPPHSASASSVRHRGPSQSSLPAAASVLPQTSCFQGRGCSWGPWSERTGPKGVATPPSRVSQGGRAESVPARSEMLYYSFTSSNLCLNSTSSVEFSPNIK